VQIEERWEKATSEKFPEPTELQASSRLAGHAIDLITG